MSGYRVLFVDDESCVLEGLRRMMHPYAGQWRFDFATSAEEALSAFREYPYDVIVSDFRMPGMDGADLLEKIHKEYPNTIRIILSGYAEEAESLRMVRSVHRFLSKPCDPQTLLSAIRRTSALRRVLGSSILQRVVAGLESLPTLPDTYSRICDLISCEEPDVNKIGEIISHDVGMTANVLHLVNSAFFGLGKSIADPREAVRYLGFNVIKALVLGHSVFRQMQGASESGLSLEEFTSRSLRTACLARRIAEVEKASLPMVEHAFTAGLLHDVGMLVLAHNLPAVYRECFRFCQRMGFTIQEAEKLIFGATHAEVGAYLLALWGLPDDVVEAVGFHHRPLESGGHVFTPLTVVHVAVGIVSSPEALTDPPDTLPVDRGYLAALSLAEHLPRWQALGMEEGQAKAG